MAETPINPDKKNFEKKRNLVEFLPSLLQTPVLKSFFHATINQLYQPQDTEEVVGYIGDIPSYHRKETDFYINERNSERQIHQLTHAAAFTSANSVEFLQYYNDLLNYLEYHGSIITDQNRLFSENFYSWSPPINLDAFVNYRNYYWLPSSPEPIVIDDLTDLDSIVGLPYATITVNGEPLELESHMLIQPKNDVNPANNNRIFIVEGVGKAIVLVEDEVGIAGWDILSWDEDLWDNSLQISNIPDYFVMERGAKDKNAWSRKNRWFHKSVIKNFNDPNLVKIQAKRPIIMFERDLELWNHGTNFLMEVNVVTFCPQMFSILNNLSPTYGIPPYGGVDLPCEVSDILYSETWPDAGRGISNVIIKDVFGNSFQVSNNMIILFANSSSPGANNRIYRVTGISEENQIIQLEPLTPYPNEGDYVTFTDPLGFEYVFFFDGNEWKRGQSKQRVNQPPLFQLYDKDLNRLDDISIYNSSNFSGSRIFGYAIDDTNTTPRDRELGIRPVFNENGKFVFENYLYTERWTYIDSVTTETLEIPYYYFWHINSPHEFLSEYGNNWNFSREKSKQYVVEKIVIEKETTVIDLPVEPLLPLTDFTRFYNESLIVKVNGVKKEHAIDWTYDSPNNRIIFTSSLNRQDFVDIRILPGGIVEKKDLIFENPISLVKNAENRDVEKVSYDDVFLHFMECMRKQIGFQGSEFGINNYKDTLAERWKGERILQHTEPILKLMLLTKEDTSFVDSLRYVEREFIRFKNRFLRKTNEFWEKNLINSTNPDDWIDAILSEINFGKNFDFPFRNTGVDLTASNSLPKYIPASPAFLGITPLYKPQFYNDDKISSNLLLRQHDGSVISTFGDFRDNILFRLEERIYESAPSKFKNDYIPLYSIYDIRQGKWRNTEYSRKEFLQISKNIFHRWLSENGISFEDIPSGNDNFSINYRTVKDQDGEIIPGNWRGIYLWYYDTDRPDLFPWEMLGFSIKPSWWNSEYGPPPYTSGNAKLWEDLRDGRIRQGPRQGIDTRFSRPDLEKYIPVSTTGELLDPISIGIVSQYPIPQDAVQPFEFGDVGTIETAWYKSENFSFDLSLILFLCKPAKFVSTNWDTENIVELFKNRTDATNVQIILENYRHRPENRNLVVHNESSSIIEEIDISSVVKNTMNVNNGLIMNYGLQQWITNYLEKDLKDITENFGKKTRNIVSNLSYRCGRFVDTNNLRVDSDSFGLIPKENVKVTFYNQKHFREVVYSGVIIEKVEDGYTVNGYDFFAKTFKILQRNKNGKKKTIGVGQQNENVRKWVENTQYFVGDIVVLENSGKLYKAKETHISDNFFDATKWISIREIPKRYRITATIFQDTTGIVEEIPYGTKFRRIEEVVNFLVSYQDYLKSVGFVFDRYDEVNNELIDFVKSAREFMLWCISGIERGDVISLSPSSREIKFFTDFGFVSPVETIQKGFYSVLNRFGNKIPPKNVAIMRDDNIVRIIPVNEEDENSLLYFARLSIETIEHALVFNNNTIFGNVINNGILGVFLPRLRISTISTKNWNGRYEIAGFIITPDKIILPNYDKLADQFISLFDINDTSNTESQWKDYAFHNIGYQKRSYLSNLLISDKSQVNFYQGLIKTKGTKQSLEKILRSQFITNITNIEMLEEWMLFASEYGNVDDNRKIVFSLNSKEFRQNPQIIEFKLVETESIVSGGTVFPSSLSENYFYDISSGILYKKNNGNFSVLYSWKEVIDNIFVDSPSDNTITYRIGTFGENIVFADDEILEKPSDFDRNYNKNHWLWNVHHGNTDFVVSFAGHLQKNEVKHQFFDKRELFVSAIPSEFELGDRVWIYEVFDVKNSKYKDWSVFECMKITNAVSSFTFIANSSGDNEMKISFVTNLGTSANRTLKEGDIIVIKAENTVEFEGIYEIKRMEGLKDVIVTANPEFRDFIDASALSTINGFEILNFVEVRFKDIYEAENEFSTNYYISKNQSYSDKLLFIDDFRNENEKFFLPKYYGIMKVTSFNSLNLPGRKFIYSVHRIQNKFVDSSKFDSLTVRDRNTKSILAKIPVYDPLSDKILPEIKTNVDFMIGYDPAIYTNGDESVFVVEESSAVWSKNKVGKIWFNTRKAKYLDYKTTSDEYSRENWGKLAPKSKVEIAEWIESSNPPSSYNGDGVPLYGENSPYVITKEKDSTKNIEITKYYFWVTDSENVSFGKTLSTKELASLLKNSYRNHNWYSPLRNNSLLISLDDSLKNETFLSLPWNDEGREDISHKEWYIVRENTSSWLPSNVLWNKMIDSLTGFDYLNRPVPDPKLPLNDSTGISVRPRRSMFVNREEAVRNLIYFMNWKLEKIRFLEEIDFSKIYISEKEPQNTNFVVDNFTQRDALITSNLINVGQTVLVRSEPALSNMWSVWKLISINPISWKLVNIQKYRTDDFIQISDFYSEEVDKNKIPVKIFNSISERNNSLLNGFIEENEVILLNDNGFGLWEWQKWNGTSWITLAKQNSTIQLKDAFYKNRFIFGIFENEDLNSNIDLLKKKIDFRDGRLELRHLLNVFRNENLLGQLFINEIFFNQLRYALTESNNNSSWIVKSSTLILGNIIENATRETTVRPDIVKSLIEYLEEIKPYHSKFRQITKTLIPPTDNLDLIIDDFDQNVAFPTSANLNLLRKFETTLRFDRVSCDEDFHPEKIMFETDGSSTTFRLFNTTEVTTEPFIENYNPFDFGKEKLWSKSNIRKISIFRPNGTHGTLDKNRINIIISTNEIIVVLDRIYENGTRIVIERWINAAERIDLYYQVVSSNIFGRKLEIPPPVKNVEDLISGCTFKGIIVEGGGLELSPEYFQATQDNILIHIYNPLPNESFFVENLAPVMTPDGIVFQDYMDARGNTWLESYISSYSTQDNFIELWNKYYGFNVYPLSNVTNIHEDIAISADSIDLLYDVKISGISTTTSGIIWQTVSSPFNPIYEGGLLSQPHISKDHPEELLPVTFFDTALIRAYGKGKQGYPPITSLRFSFSRSELSGLPVKLNAVPHNRESLIIFGNGNLLEEGIHYIFDYENLKVTFLPANLPDYEYQFDLRIFEAGGGSTLLKEKHLYINQENFTIDLDDIIFSNITVSSNLYATVDGYEAQIDIIGNTLTFNSSATSSAKNILSLYIFDGSDITKTRREKLSINSSSLPVYVSIPLSAFTRRPYVNSILVFSSGKMLCPPYVERFTFSPDKKEYSSSVDISPGIDGIRVYNNGSILTLNDDYTVSSLFVSSLGYSANVVEFTISAMASISAGNTIEIVTLISGDYDYDIIDVSGEMKIMNVHGSTLTYFWWDNSEIMNLKVNRFHGGSRNFDTLDFNVQNIGGIFVSENGIIKTPHIDYNKIISKDGWDVFSWDSSEWDEVISTQNIIYKKNIEKTCVFYISGIERGDAASLLKVKSDKEKEKTLEIRNRTIFTLEEAISARETSILLRENIHVHPAFRNSNIIFNGNVQEGDSSFLWIGTEKIEFRNAEVHMETSGHKIWKLNDVNRGVSHTPRGINEEKTSIFVTSNSAASLFTISGLSALVTSSVNINVSLILFGSATTILIPNYSYNIVPVGEIPLKRVFTTSALASENYTYLVNGNNIEFGFVPPAARNIMVSGSEVSAIFLPNIVIDITRKNWKNEDNSHDKEDLVILQLTKPIEDNLNYNS